MARTQGGRCSGNLLRAKLIAIASASGDSFPEAMEGGTASMPWVAKQLHSFLTEYGLTYRKKNITIKATSAEIQRRLGCFWRNVIRFRAWCGGKCDFDAFDHTPFYRRMNDGRVVAEIAQKNVGAKEDNAGNHARFTVVLFSSNDGTMKSPEVLFKAKDPRMLRDLPMAKIPTNLSIRFTSTATYDEESTIAMVCEKFSQETLAQATGAPWRGLLIDQFAGQLTPSALNAMIKKRRAPIVIWGHLTPWVQVADQYQNQRFKCKYQELEAQKVATKMQQRPTGTPQLTRAEILYVVAQTQKELLQERGFAQTVRKEFYGTGTCVALDGSEDCLISSHLKKFWGREGIAEWREKYLGDLRDSVIQKPGDVFQLIESFENPHVGERVPVEERLDHILAEDEVVQEGEGRQEHEGRNADGPGKEADDAAKDTVPAYDEAGREASVETQESILKDRYAASRGHKRGGPDEVASQDGNHQMA